MEYHSEDDRLKILTHHFLLLNYLNSGKHIEVTNSNSEGEIVIVTSHPDILKKVYDKDNFYYRSIIWAREGNS